MDSKQEKNYSNLIAYKEELHESNKKRIKSSGILLVLLPVILGLIRWITDSDKFVFLIIWVFCMFLLAAYLVGIEYLDHTVQKKLNEITGSDEEAEALLDNLEIIPSAAKERIRSRFASGSETGKEEGGGE